MEVIRGSVVAGLMRVGRTFSLLILGAELLLAPGYGQSTLQRIISALAPADSPADSQQAVGAHLKGAPLPSGPGTPCEKDFNKKYAAWYDRTLTAHLPAQMDPAIAAYAHAALAALGGAPLSDELITQSRTFDLDSVKDPGLLFLLGFVDFGSTRGLAALKKSLDAVPGSSYPKFVWFLAASNYGRSLKATGVGTDDQFSAVDQQSLDYLRQSFTDDSFRPDEMLALRCRLSAPSALDLISRTGPKVGQILESSTGVAPWVTEYVEGCQAVEDAWKARGGGWANTVTDQGWKGFAQGIAVARAHLTKSWQLNPHDPAAAGEMVTVCMAESEQTDTMRKWFDRSVAADFDYMEAYSKLALGLRPRWLGNFAEMTAFGRECAATGRYDTAVPYILVSTAMKIAEDSDNHAAPFEDKKWDVELLGVLDRYFSEPSPPVPTQYARTIAAILAHKLGRMDEVRKHLAAINYQPVMNDFYKGLDDLPALVVQAQASPTP